MRPRPPAHPPCRPPPRRAAARSHTRPRSDAACGRCRSLRRTRGQSRLEPQLRRTNADDVALHELARPIDADAVHVRAVRGAEVVHPDPVAPRLDANVPCGRELVLVDRDIVLAAAADRERGRGELVLTAGVEHRAHHDEEQSRTDSLFNRPAGNRRPEDEALLRQAQVLRRRANDAPDEEVEQHEEGDLEHEEHALVRRAGGDHSRSVVKVSSVEPTVNVSPESSFARLTRRPFTSIPFVESRSTIQYVAPSWRSSAWRRETFGSSTWMSHSRERPSSTLRLSTRRVW